MASSVIHMTIASEINKVLKRDNNKILIGSIAPDISKLLGETKARSHFLDSKESIINKLIISNSMVESEKFGLYNRYKNNEIQKPNLSEDDWDIIAYGINLLKNAPIYIASDVPYSIDDICINSTRFKKEKNIEAIIIDYLQLIQFNKKKLLSRDEEITEILRRLKVLAKILDIPVIITSQLSRECEKREDKKPIIEDFSNSKNAIDKYADKILFLYRK